MTEEEVAKFVDEVKYGLSDSKLRAYYICTVFFLSPPFFFFFFFFGSASLLHP